MYNRYIPQPDGSYRHRRMDEPKKPAAPGRPAPRDQVCPPAPPPPPPPPESRMAAKEAPSGHRSGSITGFFRQLLPKDLDTGDLLILLLMLLMAGDSEEEKSNALLTVALYFLM